MPQGASVGRLAAVLPSGLSGCLLGSSIYQLGTASSSGGPSGIRTPNLSLKRRVLLTVELTTRIWWSRVDSNHRVGYPIYSQAHSTALPRLQILFCSAHLTSMRLRHLI